MLLMRKIALALLLVAATGGCEGRARHEITARRGNWELRRVTRSSDAKTYYYDLRYDGRSVAVAGELTTPLGTFTMAAPTDHYSDAGWLRDFKALLPAELATSRVSEAELSRGFYQTEGRFKKMGTPPDWVFQWFEPRNGTWMRPGKLFDGRVAAKSPPAVTNS